MKHVYRAGWGSECFKKILIFELKRVIDITIKNTHLWKKNQSFRLFYHHDW